ncbi:MAG: hypothetical protein JWP88_668, partial [Flaviaesturariibacter sp.]|nr:hypothetical protein [Flaviaesturariibacter sp.]
MKTYLLLRDNHETGPHTLEELKALSLGNLDLIWVEGVSQHWDFATEFTELKPFVTSSTQPPKKQVTLRQSSGTLPLQSRVFVTLPK